ncbi:MAG: hypothetical protein ACI8WY_004355 [Planctomycetota bacterium]|jgi:hypothetical protein
MPTKLALSLTLLAASCSSVSHGPARPPQRTWDHGVTLALSQRYVASQWEPARDYHGGSIEYSGLVRDERGQGTGVEVSFARAESKGNSHVITYRPSTWRRWTDYSIGVRHERPFGYGRWLLSGGLSYIHVDLNQTSLFETFRYDLGSTGAYLRTGYIQPIGAHLELVVSGRYRAGKDDSILGNDVDLDQAGIDVGLTWRF